MYGLPLGGKGKANDFGLPVPVPMNRLLPVFRLALILLVAGCSFSPLGSDDPLDELRAHRALWNRQSLDDYRFQIQIGCFCPPYLVQPSTVVVRADTVAAVLDPTTGEPQRSPSSDEPLTARQQADFPTIDAIFDRVERALRNEADRVEVQYDDGRGFVRDTALDVDEDAADDDVSYQISNVEANE